MNHPFSVIRALGVVPGPDSLTKFLRRLGTRKTSDKYRANFARSRLVIEMDRFAARGHQVTMLYLQPYRKQTEGEPITPSAQTQGVTLQER
jgi:hypothetical protein